MSERHFLCYVLESNTSLWALNLQPQNNRAYLEPNNIKEKSLRLEEENKDLKKRIQMTEQKLAELDKLVREAIEHPSRR